MKTEKKFSIATRLRESRIERGFGVDELTKKANVAYITYQKIESGITDNPTIKNLARVCRILKISIDELVQDMDWNDEELKNTKKK